MRIALFALTAVALASCSRSTPATPQAAYHSFLSHIAQARSGGASDSPLFDDFDTPTREALLKRSTAASQAAGTHQPTDALYQLLQGPPPVAPTGITVVEQKEDKATLQVDVDAGTSGKVLMVREGGRWRVHLDLDAT